MTARKKLEQEAHELKEVIKAAFKELDLKALADADRQMLKKQIDQRVAARKHILKQLWVTPRIVGAEHFNHNPSPICDSKP
jgi:frataxin-like iron-binding protein CyaY